MVRRVPVVKLDVKAVLADAVANRKRLLACPRHRFEPVVIERLGTHHACLVCGGVMRLTEIGDYARGYRAAGGDPDDIWPGLIR